MVKKRVNIKHKVTTAEIEEIIAEKHIEYEKERNKLILFAEEFANEQFGAHYDGDNEIYRLQWCADWTRCFHDKMNELAKKAGLVG